MRKIMIPLVVGLALAACGRPDVPEARDPIKPLIVEGRPDLPAPGVATQTTRTANAAIASRLPLGEPSDLADAQRGLLAQIEGDAIRDEKGNTVWAIPQFDFLEAEAPDTVNPSLWRQSRLAALHGLFEVGDGIWQVRGYDLSVMSIIEGETGWILVDPLTTTETAAAALKLVNDTLGERPVTAVLYTHSHADHFGGARGVVTEVDIAERGVEVIAPIGFAKHAVSENLVVGNHMSRRSTLMFGAALPRTIDGHVGSGLGPGLPQGTVSLVLPTEEVDGRGTRRVIDGVTFEFIDAAGTEAPAEFMFYLPEKRALCTAEVATGTLHNVLTPRGALVRDALAWSQAIDHVLAEYGEKSDVVFASHHWPSWGMENVQSFLTDQRDIYRYIHDQTVRQANAGATMVEAAEAIAEPAFQGGEDAFHTRGYYGTLNHNSKAVYQHYFGWWGGVPADYHRLPAEVSAERYVAAMGGTDGALNIGAAAFDAGDYRWAAEVFNHVVFADPANAMGRAWLAASYEQLGFQAESGAWRSYYLSGASELRNGVPNAGNPALGNEDFLKAVPSLQLFDALAGRYNPRKLDRDPFILVLEFPDTDEILSVHVNEAVMVPRVGDDAGATARVTVKRDVFNRILLGETDARIQVLRGNFKISGDRGAVTDFFGALDQPEFWFPTVTP